MHSLVDDFSYHGISFDERMAIFRLFRDGEKLETTPERQTGGAQQKVKRNELRDTH